MKLDDYKSFRVANSFLQAYMSLLMRRGHGAEELHGVVDMFASERGVK